MSEIPGITVGELERPAALRRRAERLRRSADRCEEGTSRESLFETAGDLEAEATLLEYDAIQFR